MTKNILIVGVGGQGTLLTGRIIGNYALSKGQDVKMSEVHGMAQRGGSVVMQVKYGDKVYSPLVEIGEADIIFAFEKLEALRYSHYLKKDGVIIANTQRIDPMPVVMGKAKYPENIEATIKEMNPEACLIDALSIAKEIGNVKVVNMIMIGAYAAYIGDTLEEWKKIVEDTVPQYTIEMNQTALKKGYEAYINR
ncbi:MAG: indolepyruvate oxidoreductase subunit beta [Niameybacter sp.]|uniref:indolepyruvate oxidoreductase subunit beta n=1 Tax=Niameybacter sp. TaxID=2033640 RepID=UPI002FC8C748